MAPADAIMRYAEVIGDPIAQSKSPIIHKHWLKQLGLSADYKRTHVPRGTLAEFLDRRRRDPDWLGCNVTIPHKEQAATLVDRLDAAAERIGAVNCIVPEGDALVGYNTDVDGVGAALGSAEIGSRKVALIGAGGGARAAVAYLASRGIGELALLVRKPERAEGLRALAGSSRVSISSFEQADQAFESATAIVNASPLGMTGAQPMPESLLNAVRKYASGATIFDMVTTPSETEFLTAAREAGGSTVDGLTMLVGQAARAFALFYGAIAPAPDDTLRDLLITDSGDSASIGYNPGLKH
jgi:shikimate dehydrogenase